MQQKENCQINELLPEAVRSTHGMSNQVISIKEMSKKLKNFCKKNIN
jgi:hypothetical protein